jgi:hypothetical protein
MMGGGDPADMQTDTIDLFHTLEDQMQAFDPKRHLDMESAKAAAAKASKNPTLSDLEQMKRSINGVVDELKLSDDRKKDRLAEKCRTKVLWVEWRYNEIIGKVRLNQWKDMVKAALTGEHGGVITSHAAIQPGRWQIIDSQIRDGFQSATEPIPKNVDETGVQDDSLKKLGDRMVGSHTLQLAIRIIDLGNGKDVVYKGDGSGQPDTQANVNVTLQQPSMPAVEDPRIAAMQKQIEQMASLLEKIGGVTPPSKKS